MTDGDAPDPDLEPVEAIYDALEFGDPEAALLLARRALAEAGADQEDPVLHFLAGVALLELDRAPDAVVALTLATELDPEDAEFRARFAEALFASCRFGDAEREARKATINDPRLPHGHWILGLILERSGSYDDAEEALVRAADLAPDEFYAPARLAREEFDRHLEDAIADLPERFRTHLGDVTVCVEDLPADDLLSSEEPPLDPELLGLFVGTPRTDESVFSTGGELPPRIFLFQRNLERHSLDSDELRAEIGVTLRHELGHYLGLDEDAIARAGHA